MLISEIFHSVQGEGILTGVPAYLKDPVGNHGDR